MAFVEIKSLGRRYSSGFSLQDISMELEKGEIMTLMGPSGSGKTSLLRNISGLDMPDSGKISVDGRDITSLPAARRNVGMIFQDLAIFPHMTVYNNIAYGMRARKSEERDVERRVLDLAGMLRISDLLDRYPGQISGGQRQRVALARSVAPGPSLLLLDEPMSSLDMQLRSDVRSEVKSFSKKMGLTLIYVTHDHAEGLYMADRTGLMYDGQMEEMGSPREIFTHPPSERTARFFGYNVVKLGGDNVAFYPTDFEFAGDSGDLKGEVVSIGFEGEHERLHVAAEGGEKLELLVQPGNRHSALSPGDRIMIRITRPEKIRRT